MDHPSKLSFVAAWRGVLTHLLGWPEARVQRFVAGWSAPDYGMSDPTFYHHHPLEYVFRLLIPDQLGPPLGLGRVEVHNRFFNAVFPNANRPGFPPADYDWQAARERASLFLSQFGASLPVPEEVTSGEQCVLDLTSAT